MLERARGGDEEAFGELMVSHYEQVFRLVHSIVRNEADAREVCQDVWLKVWQKLSTFRGDAKFSTWLHPIAVRRSLDHLRKQRRWYDRMLPFRTEVDETDASERTAAAEPVDETADPREPLERAEQQARFERALAALPPKHRAVLALREIEGLSYEEIARAVGCRPGTVMSRLFNARRKLVRQLEELPCE